MIKFSKKVSILKLKVIVIPPKIDDQITENDLCKATKDCLQVKDIETKVEEKTCLVEKERIEDEVQRKEDESVPKTVKNDVESKIDQYLVEKEILEEAQRKETMIQEAVRHNEIVKKYVPQLRQLYDIGFTDMQRNLKLLVTFNGKTEDVIATLIQN